MTLCVSAECTHGKSSRFVFAKDFKVETGTATAEIEAKYTAVGKYQFPALIAGIPSRAIELATLIGDRLDADESNAELLVDIARHGVRELKHKIANEYVGAMLGITYDKVLAEGERILPPEKRREILDDISRLEIGCSLLWMAFSSDNESIIMRINENGVVDRCSNFAAIGSGLYIAEATLFQREQKIECSLGRTIYHVFEAMKLGSLAPGVGEKFSMHIVSMNGGAEKVRWECLSAKYEEYLEEMFKKFGPKKIRGIKYKSEEVKTDKF